MGALSELTDEMLDMACAAAKAALNDKQAEFARQILLGATNRAAYKAAGYQAKTEGAQDAAACQALKQVKISRYLAAEYEKIARVENITKNWVIRKQIHLAKLAEGNAEYATAKACVAEVAKLLDFYPAQKVEAEVRTNDSPKSLADLPAEAWAAMLAADSAAGENAKH